MSKLFLRAVLAGAAAGTAVAQTPLPPPVVVAPPPIVIPAPAPPAMVLKTFDLADLVCPPADSPLAKPGTDKAMIAAAKAYSEVRAEEVFKAVRSHVGFGTWAGCGGTGTMELTSDGKTLVVRNTAAVVEKVGPCVEAVRQANSSRVKVEVRLLSVPSGHAAVTKVFGDKPHASMTTAELSEFILRLQESPAVNVLTNPQMEVLNKQTGFCQVTEPVAVPCGNGTVTVSPVGTTTRVTPEVSADLKTLVLAVEVEHSARCGGGIDCQKAQMNVVVPDGGSMAFRVGTRTVERKIESKVPVVGDIPYVGRLFHSIGVSSEPTDVVAVVTATRVTESMGVCAPPAGSWREMPSATASNATLRPFVTPVGVALPQPVRAVAADGLERVGVSFNTLTGATSVPPVAGWVTEGQRVLVLPRGDAVRVAALPGRNFVQFTTGQWAGAAVSAVGAAQIPQVDDTAGLMAQYQAACAAGRKDEAAKLAVQLLAKDPTCFGKR